MSKYYYEALQESERNSLFCSDWLMSFFKKTIFCIFNPYILTYSSFPRKITLIEGQRLRHIDFFLGQCITTTRFVLKAKIINDPLCLGAALHVHLYDYIRSLSVPLHKSSFYFYFILLNANSQIT